MTEPTPFRALVTGATGGIGHASCMALIEDARRRGLRARIAAAASRPGPALDALVADLRAAGAEADGFHADLGDAAACVRLAEEAVNFCGGLDVLVSNAGRGRPGALTTLSVDDWDLLFNVNTRATWLLARTAHAALAQSGGAVVAIASMAGLNPHPGSGAYSSSKAALVMLCRQLAQEWAADGIRVNSISPGMIRTPLTEATYQNEAVARRRVEMVPMGRIGTPEDIARTVAYLAGPDAGYVTGTDHRVDGGLCDHLLATLPGLPPKA